MNKVSIRLSYIFLPSRRYRVKSKILSKVAMLRSTPLQTFQTVERALQDVGGRHSVDDFGAFGARGVLRDQFARYSRGRQALVPEGEGQGRELRKIAHEGARRLRARPFGAVHIERQPDDQGANIEIGRAFEQGGGVLRELHSPDRIERRREPPLNVRKRQSDGFGPEIQSHQPALRRQKRRQFFKGRRAHGHRDSANTPPSIRKLAGSALPLFPSAIRFATLRRERPGAIAPVETFLAEP